MQYKRFNLFYTETGFPPLLFCIFATMKRQLTYIIILLVLSSCVGGGKYTAMRKGLDSINTLNRNDQPFTSAGVQPYVDYFDDHGTPNDQMLAHYLLGRAYHEHGEAPMALKCYQEATELADTTVADCDYKQLSRVYGQMADIFYHQGLYKQELIYDKLAEKFAWKGKDTLAALMNKEQESMAYQKLGMLDSAIAITEQVSFLYQRYGYSSYSAIALSNSFRTLIRKEEYDKAKKYMLLYEQKSGLFNLNGNIEKGREIYYNIKGSVLYHEHQLDSAEFWFRKELSDGKDFNNQNAGAYGLAMVYGQRHQSDSAAKYYRYAYAMNDSMYAQQTTSTIERMQAMYDYTRHQEQAHLATVRASRIEKMVWICIGIILLLILIGYVVYEQLSHRRQEMESKYLRSLEIIKQARQDIILLKESQADNAKLIAEKEKVIYEQKDYLKTLPIDSLIYKQFSIKGQEPTQEEWQQIEGQVFELFPRFREFMENHVSLLNDKEYKTCILIRAGFKPKSISNMLNVGPSYISNIRTEMLKTLFGIVGSSKVFDEILKGMN